MTVETIDFSVLGEVTRKCLCCEHVAVYPQGKRPPPEKLHKANCERLRR